jgi:spore germination protein YaaH
VRWQPDPALAALPKAGGKPRVMPIVSNAHDTVWDAPAAEAVLTDPAAGQAVIAELVAKATAQNYAGYVLDFETLTPRAQAGYAPFLARLRAALKPSHRELWVTAFFSAGDATLKALGQSTDAVVLMAYDQCWATSTPGPIAGLDWLNRNLDARLPDLDPAHTLVALGAYGYDWPQGAAAKVVSAPQAQALAVANHAAVARNVDEANPHFAYTTPDGRAHQVWWLDAAAYRAQRAAALARHARGVAVWRLGLEDPATWAKPGAGPAFTATPPAPFCTLLPPAH